MGKKDISINAWLEDKERFADLFNGLVFEGEQVIRKEELTKLSGESAVVVKDKNRRRTSVKRYRDVVMEWQGITLMVLALENQDKVNYQMPLKTMVYDTLNYTEQAREKWRALSKEQKRQLSGAERLSRYKKDNKLVPVITLVIYFGEDGEWDGPRELYDMLDMPEDSRKKALLHKLLPNYKLNLVELNKINELKIFNTDLQVMLGVVKYKKDKRKLIKYTEANKEYFSSMSDEEADALIALLNDKKGLANWIEKQREEYEGKEVEWDMCQAIRDLVEDGRIEGRKEGRREGRKEGLAKYVRGLEALAKNVGGIEAACKLMETSVDEYELARREIAMI